MALPSSWVDRIFDKLTLVYGHHFLGRWSGLDLDKVKADWGHELDGFERVPEGIKHALSHLPPGEPPTVLQFRELCRRAPAPEYKALPLPKPDPKIAAIALSALKRPAHRGPKAWAWDLKEREERGSGLTKAQRDMWRGALAAEIEAASRPADA